MPRKPLPDHLRRRPGRPTIYPWDLWFNGRRHFIQPESDFDCSIESMRTQIYAVARDRKKHVSVRKYGDGLSVQVTPEARSDRTGRYNWDALFDGREHMLQVGRDILAEPYSFRVYARQVARARGLHLKTRSLGNIIVIQAYRKEES